jgi:hypothetical protein
MSSLISPKPGEVKRQKNREVMRAKNNSQMISFRQQLRKCLEFNPNITLATIEAKLKLKYPRQDVISGTLLQYGEPVSQFANYSEKLWSSGFHPDHGFCHTFNLDNIETDVTLDHWMISSYSIRFVAKTDLNLVGYLHDERALHSDTNAKWHFSADDYEYWAHGTLEKRVWTQPIPMLHRLPCANENKISCMENLLHEALNSFNCKAPLLNSGYINNETDQEMNNCSNDIILKVSNKQRQWIYFINLIFQFLD